jgi:hypothetical protein
VLLLNTVWVFTVLACVAYAFLASADTTERLKCTVEEGKSIDRDAFVSFLESLPPEKHDGTSFRTAKKNFIDAAPRCTPVRLYGDIQTGFVVIVFLLTPIALPWAAYWAFRR